MYNKDRLRFYAQVKCTPDFSAVDFCVCYSMAWDSCQAANENSKGVDDMAKKALEQVFSVAAVAKWHTYVVRQPVDETYLVAPQTLCDDSQRLTDCLTLVKGMFYRLGWRGDGEISLLWLPPFFAEVRHQGGCYLWYVRQEEWDKVFIITPVPFPDLEPTFCD